MKRRWLLLALTVMAAIVLPDATPAGAHAAAAALTIATEPALLPTFDPAVHDYVTRCVPGERLPLTVRASRRSWISIDGGRLRRGSVTTSVAVAEGQSFPVIVFGPGWRRATYHVRCLPLDFPAFASQRTGRTQAQWYVVAPFGSLTGDVPPQTSMNYVAIFGTDGAPVWWYRATTPALDAKLLPGGNIGWMQFNETETLRGGADVHRLNGAPARHVDTVGGGADHHELQLLRNGNYLLARYPVLAGVDLTACGGPASGAIYDNELQEIATDGSVVWSWRASDHLSPADVTPRWRDQCTSPADIYHFNSVEPDRGGYVLSLRHLDAVLRIDRRSGAITWRLGGVPRPESLAPIGDPDMAGGGFAGQHDARILPDGTLTVHDNGTRGGRPPRAVRYRLNLPGRTATLMEDVRDSAVTSSPCCGSARRLAGGNWVTAWGGQPFVTELTPAGAPVFRLTFTHGMFTYRANPIEPGRLHAHALRRGMDEMHPRDRR